MWLGADRDAELEGDEDQLDDYDAPYLPAGGRRDPDAYWRRRFYILAAGVTVVVAAVWLYHGGTPKAPRQTPATQASMAALAQGNPLPSVAYGDPYPTATATPSAPARPSAMPKPTHSKQVVATHTPRPTGSPGNKASGPQCSPAKIVLSLSTGQPSYGPTTQPEFNVYAVSTASAPCQLPYGPGTVRIMVTAHGHVVWDSAACKLTGDAPRQFRLGVPQVLTFTWNRKAVRPAGCGGTLPAGSTGTFDVVATADGQSSPVKAFQLTK